MTSIVSTDTEKSDRHTLAQMLGEFFREAAVLLFVFVPLDWIFESKPTNLTPEATIGIFILSGVFLVIGILLELRR